MSLELVWGKVSH